jgi:hypothetical protein
MQGALMASDAGLRPASCWSDQHRADAGHDAGHDGQADQADAGHDGQDKSAVSKSMLNSVYSEAQLLEASRKLAAYIAK